MDAGGVLLHRAGLGDVRIFPNARSVEMEQSPAGRQRFVEDRQVDALRAVGVVQGTVYQVVKLNQPDQQAVEVRASVGHGMHCRKSR